MKIIQTENFKKLAAGDYVIMPPANSYSMDNIGKSLPLGPNKEEAFKKLDKKNTFGKRNKRRRRLMELKKH